MGSRHGASGWGVIEGLTPILVVSLVALLFAVPVTSATADSTTTALLCPPDDGFEDNDTQATATGLTDGVGVSGITCDDDWFSLPVTAGTTITAEALFSHAAGDIDMTLYDPTGGVVGSSTSVTDNESITHAATMTGNYAARGYAGAQNTYNVTMTTGPDNGVEGTVVPDSGFGVGGVVVVDFDSGVDHLGAVLEQADGTILVAGVARPEDSPCCYERADAVVARFSANGSVDTTFGVGGFAVTPRGGETDYFFNDLAIQPDGKIVAAGTNRINLGFGGNLLVARFLADGTPDTSFDSDGLLELNLGGRDAGAAVTLQADGKIVVGGAADDRLAAIRLESDGSLDATFDTDGIAAVFSSGSSASDIAVQSDGDIVLAGTIGDEGDIALVRLLSDGSLDTSFDGDGKATIDLGGDDGGRGAALQADGKLVVAGESFAPGNQDAVITRTTTTGALDSAFDSDGVVAMAFGAAFEQFIDVAIQPDDRIVVVGSSGASWIGVGDFVVGRVLSDGSPDPTFDDDGKATFDLGDNDRALGLALQADGKILVVGGSDADWAILRLTADDSDAACNGFTVTVDIGAGDSPTEGDDVIEGTDGSDNIDGLGGNDTICGRDGDDELTGGLGDDTILGGTGNDTLKGQQNNDTLYGGPDDDLILGNAGNDVGFGDAGIDDLKGGSGVDTLDGGADDDEVRGGSDNDTLTGGTGNDVLNGGQDLDTVSGGIGDDTVNGAGSSDPSLNGDEGNDLVRGGNAGDTLNGGPGDDLLLGVLGADTLNGGPGNDDLRGGDGTDDVNGDEGDDDLRGGAGTDDCDGGIGGEVFGDQHLGGCETITNIP